MLYKDFDLALASDRIRITPLLPSDTEPYARLMYGVLYDTYVRVIGKVPSLELKSEDEIHALRLPDNDTFIGWIALQKDEEDRPDIGVHLVPERQNQGLGPEAVRLFVNHLHKTYGLEKVFLRIKETNLQSRKAAVKLGAVKYGTVPDPTIMALREELPNQDWHEPENVFCYYLDLPV